MEREVKKAKEFKGKWCEGCEVGADPDGTATATTKPGFILRKDYNVYTWLRLLFLGCWIYRQIWWGIVSGWNWSLTLGVGKALHFCSSTHMDTSAIKVAPALLGDMEGGLRLPLGCWWIVYVVLTSTFSSYSCVWITSHVFKSDLSCSQCAGWLWGDSLSVLLKMNPSMVRFQGLLGKK